MSYIGVWFQILLYKGFLVFEIIMALMFRDNTEISKTVCKTNSDEYSVMQMTCDQEKKKINVLILPIFNSYNYAIQGYDFLPTLKKELQKNEEVKVILFPYEKLKETSFHGVFSKKSCLPIIKNVEADYILMSRFVPNPNSIAIGEDGNNWGVEIKIINTTTLEEKNLLKAKGLKSFTVLKNHIKLHRKEIIAKILK